MTSCHILLSLLTERCIVCGSEDEAVPLARGQDFLGPIKITRTNL